MQILKRLSHERLGMIGLVIVLIWAVVAIFAPLIAPPAEGQSATMMFRPTFSAVPLPPNGSSWFGTTGGGYDIFYGIVWGSRTAFVVGLITVFCTALIGVTLGAVGAYLGGVADYLIMRLVDLFMSMPFIIAVIVMTVALGKGLDKIIIALVVFGWPAYARVIRSEVLAVKQRDYVHAAKLAGASPWHILMRHVMPNSIYPIIVLMSINIGRIVLVAASMSFIGIGTEPGYADWGQLLNYARNWLSGVHGDPFRYWYTYLYPSIAVFSFVLGWTFLGDSLRDIADT